MSTTSIVPAAIDSLLTLAAAGMTGANSGVGVFEAWPGPKASQEMLCFGETTWDDYRIPTIKSGRVYRDEDFQLGFEVLIFGATGTTPAAPKPARDRAFAVLTVLDTVLAADPRAGLANDVIKWAGLKPQTAGPRLFEKAWAYRIAGVVYGHARLT